MGLWITGRGGCSRGKTPRFLAWVAMPPNRIQEEEQVYGRKVTLESLYRVEWDTPKDVSQGGREVSHGWHSGWHGAPRGRWHWEGERRRGARSMWWCPVSLVVLNLKEKNTNSFKCGTKIQQRKEWKMSFMEKVEYTKDLSKSYFRKVVRSKVKPQWVIRWVRSRDDLLKSC